MICSLRGPKPSPAWSGGISSEFMRLANGDDMREIPTRACQWHRPRSVGPTLPRGDLADTLRSGINVTGSVGFHFGESFTLRGEGMYQQLGRKLSTPPSSQQMVLVGGAAEIGLLGAKGPYVLGGYGFYQTLKSGSAPATEWRGGYSVGAGWRLAFQRLSLFGEARLHRVRGERAPAMLPISFGIRI